MRALLIALALALTIGGKMGNIERNNVLFLLATTVALEAEGESYLGKLGVA